MILKSENKENLGKRIRSEILLEGGHNSYATAEDVSMSDRTVKRCAKRMKVMGLLEATGQVKNNNRSTNFENIRNPLSCAAALTHLDSIIDYELFFSGDMVGFKLHGWGEKPTLLTTKVRRT